MPLGGEQGNTRSRTIRGKIRSHITMRSVFILVGLSCMSHFAAAAQPAAGGSACDQYEWNMNREFSLLAGSPIALSALEERDEEARFTPLDRPLQLALQPGSEVKLLAQPGRSHDVAQSFAGLMPLSVPRASLYRISSNRRLWIDVIGPQGVVPSSKFAMQPDCDKLVKSVAFRLEPGTTYWIQLTGSPAREATLLVTLDR